MLMKNFTLLILACSLFTSVGFAQVDRKVKARSLKVTEKTISTLPVYDFNGGHALLKKSPKADASVIVSEDFSKFTAGSEDAPDMTEITNWETGYIDPSYTQTPGWSGYGIYQAGGVAYLGMIDTGYGTETAFFNTPELDFSGNGGTCTFSFRAKSKLADGDNFLILLMAPGEQFASSAAELRLTNEWKEYSVSLNQGDVQNYVQMYAETGECFVDDIRIASEGLQAPTDLSVTGYKGSSATLNWAAVDGADSYRLNVLYFDFGTAEEVYLLKDEPVETNSYVVENLEPGIYYAFNVATVKGDEVSAVSETVYIESSIDAPELLGVTNYTPTSFTIEWSAVPGASSYLVSLLYEANGSVVYVRDNVEVTGTTYDAEDLPEGHVYYCELTAKMPDGSISMTSSAEAILPELEAPVATEATEITGNSFTANWNSVPYATNYIVSLSRKHVAVAEQRYRIADLSFESVESTGTMESPEYFYDMYTTSRAEGAYNWTFSMASAINGAIGLDNSYSAFFGPAFVYSPQIDFSASGGKVELEIEAASLDNSTLVVAFAEVIDNQLNEVSYVEVPVTNEMTKQTAVLEGGQDGYVVLMYSLEGSDIFFSSIKADMNLLKGAEITLPEDAGVTEKETSYKFENLKSTQEDVFSYEVIAAMQADSQNIIYSEESNEIEVKLNTAVNDLELKSVSAYVSGNVLYVNNPDAYDVNVYSVAGHLVYSDTTGRESLQINLLEQGVYLVKVGEQVFKVMR